MYKIEKTNYGLKVTVEGMLGVDEAQKYVQEYGIALAGLRSGQGMLHDARNAKPVPPEVQQVLAPVYNREIQGRIATILAPGVAKLQATRSAKTGANSRYVDPVLHPNWEEVAIKWIVNGIDPDK